jgi:hypothetical protein
MFRVSLLINYFVEYIGASHSQFEGHTFEARMRLDILLVMII